MTALPTSHTPIDAQLGAEIAQLRAQFPEICSDLVYGGVEAGD
ncbi:hypothetical protein B0G84_8038 [Paraburkholderia sp. BL8N3]|nr:hypothetical protein B0G84_8038 [Paraburkholderia sp. BL8N3]